ncbi:uncharacterized protein LOC125370011 [Ricinus communis]|uniref:uncharacterized protein LOC125370011 n=1 Tax=Ricinus communis TaxID=3988 RepID=UPI00201A6C61|nr:uncharacterized protein LOC125370011 [Ricinus communis]
MESILRYVPNKVTSKMNASLTTPFMAEDICKALFNMHPSKGLSSILDNATSQGLIHDFKVARDNPAISHLFFIEDSLIFYRANAAEYGYFKNCLHQYELEFGHLINFEKSAISFSPNTNNNKIEYVKQLFGFSMVYGHHVYIGLPTFSMRNKWIQFGYLRDKVVHRLSGWKHKLFFLGGKETLIISVIQSLPTYVMSFFRITISTLDDIERLCARFW